MGAKPNRSILAFESAEYFGRFARVRYSRSLMASNIGFKPATSKMVRANWNHEMGARPDVEHARSLAVRQIDGPGRQQRSERRRRHVVFHHPDRLPRTRQAQHQLHEIAARRGQPPGAVEARCAHNQHLVQIRLRVQLPRQLGNRISPQRVRGVVFRVGVVRKAVEYVIRREVYQPRIHLPAGQRDVPHRQRIHLEGRLRLLFRHVHLVVGRCIEDYLGVEPASRAPPPRIRDIHFVPVQPIAA